MIVDYAILRALIDRGMYISLESVFSITVFGACFMGILGMLMRQRYLNGIRYNLLLLCILLIGIRMFIPVEIFNLSYKIYVPYVLSDISAFLGREVFCMGEESISRTRLLGWIWMAGATFMLVRMMLRYQRLKRMVADLEPMADSRLTEALEQVNLAYGRGRKIAFVTSEQVSSPMVTGLRHPYIILPTTFMQSEEIYYTLCHELAHYYGGDLHIKFFWEIGKSILWWNPLVYLFQRQLCGLLELRADDRVVKILSDSEKWEYADCLVQMAKKQRQSHNRQSFVLAYGGTGSFSLKQRIEILCKRISGGKQKKVLSDLVTVLCLFLVLIVPNVIFEPASMPEPEEGEVFTGIERFSYRDPGVFMIDNQDGTYDFYYDYTYCCTTEKVFDLTVKVYQNLEEALDNEQVD